MENNTSSLMKLTLYDRIFKPQTVTLPNGHSVQRRRSRTPVIVLFLAVAIWLSLRMTGFDLHVVITKFRKMVDLLEKILQPDWSFFPKVVSPLIDTIKMSILGTVIGCAIALPVAILSSSNINKSIPVVWLIRFLLGLIRTLPTLIIALVCALIFSLGTFSGTIAIAIFTFGIVAKMLFESIETIDMGPFEAMEALGANKFQAFWSACVPQILPVYLSHCLYCFEMNVRASAILGYVGAGGLGITINERIGWRRLQQPRHGAAVAVRGRCHHRLLQRIPSQEAELKGGCKMEKKTKSPCWSSRLTGSSPRLKCMKTARASGFCTL